MEYLHLFKTKTEHDSFYGGNKYKEPWLAYIRDNTLVTGNKSYDYYRNEYLTLSALEDGEITITIPSGINSTYATSLSYSKDKSSYSKDKSSWTDITVDSTDQTITFPVSTGDNVYLKGEAMQWFEWDGEKGMNITSSANINASGNTMSLLYGDGFKDKTAFPDEAQCVFGDLFKSNEHLINAENLILPAMILVPDCYYNMFHGCSSLDAAPELPATELSRDCYGNMFSGCTSLTTAPELPAEQLTEICYHDMFNGCSKLNSITMLAIEIPESECLNNWVSNVASTGTFIKAASMTTLPDGASGIPSGWEVIDYGAVEPQLDGLYITPAGGSAISVTPSSSYYSLHGKYLKYSFDGKRWKGWTGSVGVQPGQKMYVKGEDYYVWTDSTSGKLITSSGYYNVGGDINSLTNFMISSSSNNFKTLFMNDKYVRDASNLILPATTLAPYYYSNMFNGCSGLTAAPALPATRLAQWCYASMFFGCSSLKTAPALPATTLANYCYSGMFRNCRALTTAPTLPATTLTQQCYMNMFNGCSALVTAPALPATTLTTYCYNSMFNGCSKLNNITMLATDISAANCLNGWVNGVAATGTFTKAASMTSLPTGNSGIPSGWTVVNK